MNDLQMKRMRLQQATQYIKKQPANMFFSKPLQYTTGQMYRWANPANIMIPVINFRSTCDRCVGTGTCETKLHKMRLPCVKCYEKEGYCKRCYGTGVNIKKERPCRNCQLGRKVKNYVEQKQRKGE